MWNVSRGLTGTGLFCLLIAPRLYAEDLILDYDVHRIVLDGCMIKERRLPKQLRTLQDSFLIKLLFTCLRFVLQSPCIACLLKPLACDFNYASFQDESLLVDWKQQLDRDSETLKMKGNLDCLRTVSISITNSLHTYSPSISLFLYSYSKLILNIIDPHIHELYSLWLPACVEKE